MRQVPNRQFPRNRTTHPPAFTHSGASSKKPTNANIHRFHSHVPLHSIEGRASATSRVFRTRFSLGKGWVGHNPRVAGLIRSAERLPILTCDEVTPKRNLRLSARDFTFRVQSTHQSRDSHDERHEHRHPFKWRSANREIMEERPRFPAHTPFSLQHRGGGRPSCSAGIVSRWFV
jgi:hypothetical protein